VHEDEAVVDENIRFIRIIESFAYEGVHSLRVRKNELVKIIFYRIDLIKQDKFG
jgi:hypothetical protein